MAKATTKIEFEHEFPKCKSAIDWDNLLKEIKEHVEGYRNLEYQRDDVDHYIYEAAVEAVYGPAVWDAINERIDFCK